MQIKLYVYDIIPPLTDMTWGEEGGTHKKCTECTFSPHSETHERENKRKKEGSIKRAEDSSPVVYSFMVIARVSSHLSVYMFTMTFCP